MAQWWELAIPVAGTLGGVALTAAVQSRAGRRQRNHELRMKILDEKKESYGLYPELLFQIRIALSGFRGINRDSYHVHQLGSTLTELTQCIQKANALTRDAPDGGNHELAFAKVLRARELTQIVLKVAEHDEKVATRYRKACDEANAIVARIQGDLTRTQATLAIWATSAVQEAADRLKSTVNPELSGADFRAAKEVYFAAVRQELLMS